MVALQESSFQMACPNCGSPLQLQSPAVAACQAGHHDLCEERIWRCEERIWRFLPPTIDAQQQAFEHAYRQVRRREGWGSKDPSYYTSLPFRDISGRWPEIWRVRAVSFRALERCVVAGAERRATGPLRIVDLGAGNGWLSHRLALRGHEVMAVDLSADPLDGLGAHVHYPEESNFLPVQASFDHLPLSAAQVDLIVFNGSLHYSSNYRASLGEALRVLAPSGRLVIMDSPIYRHRRSGEAMMAEKEAELARHQSAADTKGTEGFLTYRELDRLQRDLGLAWQLHRPFYGVDWLLLPWKNRLLGRREPMRFRLIVGRIERS